MSDEANHKKTASIFLSDQVVREFWNSQYKLGKWIRFTRIVDWLTSRDKQGNRIFRDETLIDDPDRAAYLKLSNAVLLGLFKSQIILVSATWLPEGRPDEALPARMGITIDQFIEASRSSILDRWIAPTADVDLFIRAYLQNMAITNRACSDWLLREGYDLPPWLTTVDCAAGSRPGAKPRYDWLEGKAFASKVFAERGDISAGTDAVSYFEEVVSANNLEGFKDVFWNLGQIVAWVETRSPFPVDALSDSTKDLARRDHSMPPGLPHYAAEFADRSADENGLAGIKSPFQSVDDVRRAVLRSFQSGLLAASGQRRGSFDRETRAHMVAAAGVFRGADEVPAASR